MMNPVDSLGLGRSRLSALAIGLLSISSLLGTACKEDVEREPGPKEGAAPAQKADAAPPAEAPGARVDPRQLAPFRREANALFAQSDFDGAKKAVDAGLALDPEFSPLLRLKSEIDAVLSHRCCGNWLRYDTTKPGEDKKQMRAVLHSENPEKNDRGHLFRSRTILACEGGKASMTILVPWSVPESPSVSASYELGKKTGDESVQPDAKELGYVFPDAKAWWKRLAESENEKLTLDLQKRDGSKGKLVFELGETKKIIDELTAACP